MIFNEGKFTQVDEARILAEINKNLDRDHTLQEIELKKLSTKIMPTVKKFYLGWF